MADPIKPALTPDEWKEGDGAFWRGDHYVERIDVSGEGHYALHIKDKSGRPEQIIDTMDPEWLHAIAALCLHGQNFGFTWADVVNLRATALHANWPGHWADSLADRIAALLPPTK